MKIQNTFIGLFAIVLLAISPYGLASSDHRLVLTDDDTPIVKREADELSDGTSPITETTSTTTESSISSTTTETTSTTTESSISSTTTTVDPTSTPTTTVEPKSSTTTTVDPTSTPTTTVDPTSTPTTTVDPTSTPTTTVEPTSSPTTTQSPTPGAPGRKFDGLSFFGGMILAVGLGALIYLVIRYLRRSNRLPYSNLH